MSRSERMFALVGNPNCGKTTLFNELTGTHQQVSNRAGVTVERKEGKLRSKYGEATIVDLPGVYYLDPRGDDEIASRTFLVDERPDVVINIVESTNIERNLYLTCQVAELGIPMVVAVNMMDEAQAYGDKIDIDALSAELGLPVFPISAMRGEGVIEMMDVVGARGLMSEVKRQASHPFHDGEDEHGHGFQDTEDPEEHRRDHHTDEEGRTNALLSAHKYHNHYKGPMVFVDSADHPITQAQQTQNAERRYAFIADVVGRSVQKGHRVGEKSLSDKLDKVFTHPVFGIPVFIVFMWFMFHCTFSTNFLGLGVPSPGVGLQELIQTLLEWFAGLIAPMFVEGSVAYSLVFDGVLAGVGAVLSFLPQIVVLFFFLTLMEDMGYMSRAAFIVDRGLRVFGLSGKSFLPMLMGFGCNVPAMMTCRTMESEDDRKMTLFLIPFMSCGARAPIYLVFAAAFFPENADAVVLCLYLGGIVVAICTSALLKKCVFKGETAPLIIELSKYRAPRWKSLGAALWKTTKDYVQSAGTIIFCMSVVIWFFSNFGFGPDGFGMVPMKDSMLAVAGGAIAWVFAPLGFGTWIAAVSLITGLMAKEAVVGSLGVLCQSGEAGATATGLSAAALVSVGFTQASALSFMVFCLLYAPCMASVAMIKNVSGSWKWACMQAVYACAVAWVCSFAVHGVCMLCGVI